MYKAKKVVVVLPAYNASKTLHKTFTEIPMDLVDEVVLVDDASSDDTHQLARDIGIQHIVVHEKNLGYGANQKTCYRKALSLNAEIIVMLHPDYQYTPKLITAMVSLIGEELYPVVLGSRILSGGALAGGMPVYKYIANRFLTAFQNLCTGAKLSEYHTGYRAFSREIFEKIDIKNNSNSFIFDNEMLSQIILNRFAIAEVTCPTKYFAEASSIKLIPSIIYGLGVLKVSVTHLFARISRTHGA